MVAQKCAENLRIVFGYQGVPKVRYKQPRAGSVMGT